MLSAVLVTLTHTVFLAHSLTVQPPEIIIRKALKACGMSITGQPLAIRTKWTLLEGTGEKPSEHAQMEWAGETTGKNAGLLIKTNDHSFSLVTRNGKSEGTGTEAGDTKRILAAWDVMRHKERALWLLPLLQDKRYKLRFLGESNRAGRVVLGINVSFPKMKDIQLYFDKKEHRLFEAILDYGPLSDDKEVRYRYLDYRRRSPGTDAIRQLLDEGIPTLGRKPMDYLKNLLDQVPSAQIQKDLVKQLGDRSFAVRDKATLAIRKLGPSVALWLPSHRKQKELHVTRRIKSLLEEVEGEKLQRNLGALFHVIGAGELPEAASVLLRCYALVPDAKVRAEVIQALKAVARPGGKRNAILVEALKGPEPQRSVAAMALGKESEEGSQPYRLKMPVVVAHRIRLFTDGDIQPVLTFRLDSLELFSRFDPQWLKEHSLPTGAGSD